MTDIENINLQNIHAYIDGNLPEAEKKAFEKAMQLDDSLKEEVCELRKIKQQILEQYQHVDVPPMPDIVLPKQIKWSNYWASAAGLVMAFGLGFVVSQQADVGLKHMGPDTVAENLAMAESPGKVLLHIDTDQPQRVQALLQTANQLLQKTSANQITPQVEIIANDHGIDLFNESSQNKNRAEIIEMLKKYNNLKLIACQRALKRRAQMGHPVKLMAHVESDQPALDEIVKKMQQGWQYYKF